jgi:undecaprenyl diphosphate synthase
MTTQAANARTDPVANPDQRTVASLAKLGLPAETLPRHIAVIMDGNGRWARRQDKPRMFGHRAGANAVRAIVTECARLRLDALTLYSFSIENWKRPSEEVEFLMELYVEYLNEEREELMENNVRFVQIGRRHPLPQRVLEELDKIVQCTEKNSGLTLVLALNYGSRTEIADAAAAIARDAKAGRLDPNDVTEDLFQQYLYTATLPDPDLLIRTAGEMRVSNYLLWQISYAELYVSDVCWPDFGVDQLHEAIRAFARRKRKFGGVREEE